MDPGALQHQVAIQSATITRSASGLEQHTWSLVALVWAAITTSAGREFRAASQIMPELTHDVVVRYRGDITPQMRIKWYDGHKDPPRYRYFDIRAVQDENERWHWLHLMCRELVEQTVET